MSSCTSAPEVIIQESVVSESPKMDQAYQAIDIGNAVSLKRKRGRPRKDHSAKPAANDHSPPGFASRPLVPTGGGADLMVGQTVSGVIEAAFDAGYLLTVKVGNAETTFSGVIFKPGRYAPVSAENDVAPNAQMIQRTQFSLPARNQMQIHTHGSIVQSREGNGNGNGNESKCSVDKLTPRAPKGKMVAVRAAASPVVPRGNVVPVVLQPVNLSNGIPAATQALHPSSISKQAPSPALSANHAPSGTSNALPSESNSQAVPTVAAPNERNVVQIKRESSPVEARRFDLEGGIPNMNEPLYVRPLQAVQPSSSNTPLVSVPEPMEKRPGKMTELLREQMKNQVPQNQRPDDASPDVKFYV